MAKPFPWVRVAVEGVTIVGSILLAFGIEASWAGRQDRSEGLRVLRAVLEDARANIGLVDENRVYHEAALGREREILRLADAGAGHLSIAQADSLIADLTWWNGSDHWQTGALDALTGSGRLDLVQNEDLRNVLASWNRNVLGVQRFEDEELEFFDASFMPFLREEAWVPQVAEIADIMPGSGFEGGYGDVDFRSEPVDHRQLIVSPAFLNLVLQKLWIQTDILERYDRFRAELLHLVQLLEDELGEPWEPFPSNASA